MNRSASSSALRRAAVNSPQIRFERFAILLLILAALLFVLGGMAHADEAADRKTLTQAIAADGAEQAKLVASLATTNSDIVRKVLTGWLGNGIYQIDSGNGTKVPVMLEDAQDADGKQKAVRIDTGDYIKDATGKPQGFFANDLDSVDCELRLKKVIKATLDLMTINDPNPAARTSAIKKIGMQQNEANIPVLQERLKTETDSGVKVEIGEAIAIMQLKDPNPATVMASIQKLGNDTYISAQDVLAAVAADKTSSPDEVAAANHSVAQIKTHLSYVDFYGTIFRGLSYGSILLVVALGLAITFGLMGVINMAHGELIAVGAYTCYVVQNIFSAGLTLSPFGMHIHFPGMNLTGWKWMCMPNGESVRPVSYTHLPGVDGYKYVVYVYLAK